MALKLPRARLRLVLTSPCIGCAVKRRKSSAGCEARPATLFAPAGSSRSGGGGNEAAGAFETTGDSSRSASGQAITRVNVEQASKRMMWEPTRPHCGEGRRRWATEGVKIPLTSDQTQRSHRGSDDGMPVHGDPTRHGKPQAAGARGSDRQPARARPGGLGWRTGPYDHRGRVMPAEERGLSSRVASEGAREPGDWR